MEAEAQPRVEDGSEVIDEVKGEGVTDEEAVSIQQGASGEGIDVKTLKDSKGANGGESTLQSSQGAGDFRPNQENEIDAEKKESVMDEKDEETGEQREDKLEQVEVPIEDELRNSNRADEGDEVLSSKVTTVSFASEVQVLNEDDMEEQWTTTGGDNGEENVNREDDDTGGIVESSNNKADVLENTATVASSVHDSTNNSGKDERDEVVGAPVSVEGDSNERENSPAAQVQAVEQEQPSIDTAEIAAPISEVAVTVVDTPSEELDISTTQQNQVVEQEQSPPEATSLDDAGLDTKASAGEATNISERELETKQEQGHKDEDGKLDVIPVLLHVLAEEKQLEHTLENVEVAVHRSMKSSAPMVTLEASIEFSEEPSAIKVIDEDESENSALDSKAEVCRNLQADAPEGVVEATAREVDSSQEDSELDNLVETPEDDLIGVEGSGDIEPYNLAGMHVRDDGAEQGGVDNRTELEADSALPDENQIQVDNQDELYYQNLTDPNREDVPIDGNFSEYEQHPMLAGDVDPLPPIEPELFRRDQEEQRMDGLSPIELLTQANQAHGRLPLRSPHHQQHPRSGSKVESTSRATSLSRIQIARIPSPPAHVKAQMIMDEERRASTRTSSRLPPSVMKMSSVMVNARKKAVKNRDASVYYEERQFHKVLTLDECINSRPPMPFDLDTPGPCQYSPRNQPLYEDNAPEFSFGMKFPERGGGGRTAYAKTWFNSHNNYTVKTRFERRWPSPNAYGSGRSLVGRKVPDKKDYPSFSMRAKTTFTISKKGSENEPGPDQYQRQRSDPLLFRRAPAFSMGAKLDRGRLFGAPEITPAPNYYSPHTKYTSRKITYPAFTISGIRKPKSHALGPHATL